MTPLSPENSGHLLSYAPAAAGPAVEFGQLDNKVADVVLVATSFTGVALPSSAPYDIVPGSAASVAAPAPSPCNITLVVAPSDVAPVATPIKSSPALLLSVSVLSTFP